MYFFWKYFLFFLFGFPFIFSKIEKGEKGYAKMAFLSPLELSQYYHLLPLEQRILNGSTSLAILNPYLPPTLEEDIALFCEFYQLPPPQLIYHHVVDSEEPPHSTPKSGWYQEMNADVQWAHAISPGIPIHIVLSGGSTLYHMDRAVSYILSSLPDIQVVSISWGVYPERQLAKEEVSTFANLPSLPIFVVASGDTPRDYWPACSTQVLSVGGTVVSPSFKPEEETAWNESGGGYCQPMYYRRETNPIRSVPDVGIMAKPGVITFQEGKQRVVAGTSIGAPIWASILASSPMLTHYFFSSSPRIPLREWFGNRLLFPHLVYVPLEEKENEKENEKDNSTYNLKSGWGVPFGL